MRRITWIIGGLAVVALLVFIGASNESGPSDDAVTANRPPPTTTTTEPPPEGVIVVLLRGGAFRPSIVALDLDEATIVQWKHEDSADFIYVIESRDKDDNGDPLFMSGELGPGDTFEVDFSEFPVDIYRYFSFLGQQRLPGTVDTRPDQ